MSFLNRLKNLFQPQQPHLPLTYPDWGYTIPTLVISYFPVKDGHIDQTITGDVNAPLDVIREHTTQTTWRVVAALETGSTYHGYKRPTELTLPNRRDDRVFRAPAHLPQTRPSGPNDRL